MKKLNWQAIDKKWQGRWLKDKIFEVKNDEVSRENKFYNLVAFPYPSGNLHIGHWYNYMGADIYGRFQRMNGKKVMQPMGYDAFGLPAENAAIKRGLQPKEWTEQNIAKMRQQLISTGNSYDWSREITSCDPDYYKWTQWMFLFLYKQGLAERREAPANWCPSCQTILANEQVVSRKCERCDTEVIQTKIKQWVFLTTKYAEKLLEGLNIVDWPEKTKAMQRNWIGKSEGTLIKFKINDDAIEVFTTRADTIFGVTYIVLAPEHLLLPKIVTEKYKKEVDEYIQKAAKKSELERVELQKEKTGVFTGAYAEHPLTNERIPIWAADYVIGSYSTGAVMAVPAHDERDWEFAKKYKLPILAVNQKSKLKDNDEECHTEYGYLMNSREFNGLRSEKAIVKITEKLAKIGMGKKMVQYRLRDWIVSRQRYWGAPIPIIYCDKCGIVPVPEEDLPVLLPEVKDFKPKGTSPLAKNKEFVNAACPRCGNSATRETDTMDTFVCSSWYFLRYTDPKNIQKFASNKAIKKWLPVDCYVIGAEHSVMHLLYARFFCYALHDERYLDFTEPFSKMYHQGMILGPDGFKMSKSKGNVIDPDKQVNLYGADTVRMFLAFMGPFEQGGLWNPGGIVGAKRFLKKINQIINEKQISNYKDKESDFWLNKTIKKVTGDIRCFSFNTAVSTLMEWVNYLSGKNSLNENEAEILLKLISPFAPHLAEELWHEVLHENSYISLEKWPEFNDKLAQSEIVNYAIQVNGKLRAFVETDMNTSRDTVIELAKRDKNVQKYINGFKAKEIFVPGKIVNFVIHCNSAKNM